MTSRVPRRLVWLGAILLAYCGLVALAYAVGPPKESGCSIGGYGTITAANGDQSSFSMLATSTPLSGALLYRDLGPKGARQVHSTNVTTLTCRAAARGGTIAGNATVQGARLITYRVEVEIGSSARSSGSYRITLSDGYDSGTQQIEHGGLRIHSARGQVTRAAGPQG